MSNTPENKLLVTIIEAAALLSVGRSTIYKLINDGDLAVVKIGCSARVTTASIRAIAGARDIAPSAVA